jgi:hypothetical protein
VQDLSAAANKNIDDDFSHDVLPELIKLKEMTIIQAAYWQ